MNLSNETVAKIAHYLGHSLTIEPRRRHTYAARCSCGYVSAKRQTQRLAIEAAIHHQEVVIRAHMASGKSLIIDTPDEETVFETRPSVVA